MGLMSLPAEIAKLSFDERLQLAKELWESLRAEPEQLRLSPEQEGELDRRVAAYRAGSDPGAPWRDALASIGKGDR